MTERTTNDSRPAGYITTEVYASIMIPYNEAGRRVMRLQGLGQTENDFRSRIVELLEGDGVSVTLCTVDIIDGWGNIMG